MEPGASNCSTSDYFCESTPGTVSKRKRKIAQDTPLPFKSPTKGLDWSPLSPVPIFETRGLLSSTHNESFTNNFENFTINSKGEDSVWMNNTTPTTPTKSTIAGTPALLANTSKLASSVKLGSPERNSILYPSLRSTRSKPCPYSPYTSQHNTPAKKRLFTTALHSIPPLTRADPVKYLNPDTMSMIYSFLEDGELYTCVHVSKTWRRSLRGDKVANRRLERFSVFRVLNKENCVRGERNMEVVEGGLKEEQEQGKILQYYTLSRTLSEDQSLLKCVNCQNVAIVTDSISQCQSDICNYITCLKCGSFSISGHRDFLDKCRQMKLELDLPNHHCTPEKRRNTIYTFSTTSSYSTLQTPSSFASSSSSSGYFTDSSNHSSSNNSQRRMSEINQNSVELKNQRRQSVLTPSSVPNVPPSAGGVKPRLRLVPTMTVGAENRAPPSPPSPSTRREVAKGASKGKKAAKRGLRRLLL